MKITIVLPRSSLEPVGGYLVEYQLADHLAQRGHSVTIVHVSGISRDGMSPLRSFALGAWRSRGMSSRVVSWYRFSPAVRVRLVPWLTPHLLPRADVTVLTAYQTSLFLRSATSRTGPLAQVVYDYEHWASGDARTRSEIEAALGRHDIGHIATSFSVRQMLEVFGAPVLATINPAISADRFKCTRSPSDRGLSIGFSFRPEPYKGIDDLIAALELVHDQWPTVPVRCFREVGTAKLPKWIECVGYLTDVQLAAFYNDCAIFVLPSHYEGWGLPAAEAMACGAALVTTDSGGPSDFVEPGQNALLVPPKDSNALASAITCLLKDENLRLAIAAKGAVRASEMTWELNAELMEATLNALLERRETLD